jgi:hypothetical protein
VYSYYYYVYIMYSMAPVYSPAPSNHSATSPR